MTMPVPGVPPRPRGARRLAVLALVAALLTAPAPTRAAAYTSADDATYTSITTGYNAKLRPVQTQADTIEVSE